jgi:DNA-binding NarL/FixJ family response regulator
MLHRSPIIRLIAQGWDNARIAEELCLSEQTIRNYVSRLYGKIGVQTRAEAVVWGRDHGAPA